MSDEEMKIQAPLPQMDDAAAALLCESLRKRLIDTVSRTGGHLASSLGALELIVSLHRVFDTGRDRLVFDVGHQCYAHKLLTGRDRAFDTLRSLGGISGFPKPCESVHDAFVAGHASNSVSVALGMARARTLRQEDYHVIALLGDGALTGGLAYEGLNDAGESGERLIVILNDNGMSITKNVGGIAQHLAHMRIRPSYYRFKKVYRTIVNALPFGKKIYRVTHQVKTALKQAILPSSLFEDMGFTYLGPIDGHDLSRLNYILRFAKEMDSPVLIHVMTRKGKGYPPAEERPDCYHGVSCFDVETGLPLAAHKTDFSSVFGETLCRLAQDCPNLCAITAAMRDGTGLNAFAERFPERFFDVGIAEGHAVSMAAGMAKQGMIPVFAVYSTFLQRGFDMLIHDVAIQNLHVVFGVDRAGLVGQDGETHHGVFDVGYLSIVPGIRIYAPASYAELRDMLRAALFETTGPVAVRYPRGEEGAYRDGFHGEACRILRPGGDLTILTYGIMINQCMTAARRLDEDGCGVDLLKLNLLKPSDFTEVIRSVRKTGRLLVVEDCVEQGSIGQRVLAELTRAGIAGCTVKLLNLKERFVPHGDIDSLLHQNRLDAEGIYQAGMELFGYEREKKARYPAL